LGRAADGVEVLRIAVEIAGAQERLLGLERLARGQEPLALEIEPGGVLRIDRDDLRALLAGLVDRAGPREEPAGPRAQLERRIVAGEQLAIQRPRVLVLAE